MKKLYFFSILAAILALTACNKEADTSFGNTETPLSSAETRSWKVRINAGPAVETRAISVGGNNGQTLYHNWDNGDAVQVVKDGASAGSLYANQSAGNSAFATLEGTLTGTFSAGDNVTLYYHTAALDYTGQVGTIADVSTSKSYLQATSTVKSVDGSGGFLAMSDASFTPMQAYLDLSFTMPNGTPIQITTLEIWAEGGKLVKTKALDGTTVYATEASPLTITPTASTDKLFLALRDENGGANIYHFKVNTSNNIFTYEGSKNLQYGHYYSGNVTMTAMPFTIEAKDGPVTVMFYEESGASIEYSTDNGANWVRYSNVTDPFTGMVTLNNAGDKVMLRGDNPSYESVSFNINGDSYVYGNMMSLIDSDDYPTLTTLTADSAFARFFVSEDIYSHPSYPLLLPATTLSNHCYRNMFANCWNLTTAPVLPATKLTPGCYALMFDNCRALTSVTCLATTIYNDPDDSWNDSLFGWLDGVPGTGTFYINPSLDTTNPTPWSRGTSGIPTGWTVQKYVP